MPLVAFAKPHKTSELEIKQSPTLEQHVSRIFGKKAPIALAVLKYESGLKLDAINYNCRYNGKSKSCRKGDIGKAWSVDCGAGQINVKGKSCPHTLLTLDGNMAQVEKIYKEQGMNAWIAYSSGAYRKYLTS